MKVFFNGSATYKKEYGEFYIRIVKKLDSMGYDVESKHALVHDIEKEKHETAEERKIKYEEMLGWIRKADICIYEVSFPSTVTMGHSMTRALSLGKPVLALYREGNNPFLLQGLDEERFCIAEYNDKNLEKIVEFEVEELSQLPDQRFTMLMSGDLLQYLNELAGLGKTRSEYIRELIRKDMEKS